MHYVLHLCFSNIICKIIKHPIKFRMKEEYMPYRIRFQSKVQVKEDITKSVKSMKKIPDFMAD